VNASTPPSDDYPARVGPGALVTARWAMIVVAFGLVLAQVTKPGLWGGHMLGGAWSPLAVVVLWALGNCYATWRARRTAGPEETGAHLVLDVALLTVLLALMGGAMNPFTMLYFLPITLATLVSRRWTWIVAVAAVVGFGVLVAVFRQTMAGHDHGGHFGQHLLGMGLALAVTGVLMTYFVHRIASALGTQQRELERLRREVREDRYVASLGALSAGAAHELGTPLGTIALLAGELELMNDAERGEAVRGIRTELARCKDILHGMENPELSAEALEGGAPWTVAELADALRDMKTGSSVPLDVEAAPEVRAATCEAPRLALEQTLRELVTNAQRAAADSSTSTRGVRVRLECDAQQLTAVVEDDGVGMSEAELARAFEPFHSTREGSRGLGLFLARQHTRQLGGSLVLTSERSVGTRAVLRVPRVPPETRRGA
jgi:two-component system sensor histidine kinase RegB